MECEGIYFRNRICLEDRAGIGYVGAGGLVGINARGGIRMVMKPCPRCKRLMPYGQAYCQDCAPKARAELEAIKERNLKKKMQLYNSRRDPKYLTFYRSADWRRQSRAKLESVQYKCEARLSDKCQLYAVEVHHIKPIQTKEGWDKRLDWDNLEAVCTACHNGRHPEKFGRKDSDGVIDLRTIKR